MNFGLSTKYSEIDFEEVSVSDLMLIGGGCGGGGSSTAVTQSSVQQAAAQAAAQPGVNASAYANVSSPTASGSLNIQFGWTSSQGVTVTGNATVNGSTGHVEAGANASVNTGGGFWASVGAFFSSLFSWGSN